LKSYTILTRTGKIPKSVNSNGLNTNHDEEAQLLKDILRGRTNVKLVTLKRNKEIFKGKFD